MAVHVSATAPEQVLLSAAGRLRRPTRRCSMPGSWGRLHGAVAFIPVIATLVQASAAGIIVQRLDRED